MAMLQRVRSEWRALTGTRVRHFQHDSHCERCLRPWPCPTVKARRSSGEADNPVLIRRNR